VQFSKLLAQLKTLRVATLVSSPPPLLATQIKGVTSSTRDLHPHFIFVGIQGTQVNGETFIPEAINKGATVIVASSSACKQYKDLFPQVAFLETDNAKSCLAKIAALFYPKAPAHIVAVTGTNGKSSTVEFARQLWEHLGYKSASMGTLGIQSTWFKAKKHLTTPDPVYLHQSLQALHDKGITHLALEASSHGLTQYRLDGLSFSAAGFTSFSRDHLDYHGTLENYLDAKGRLFSDLLTPSHGVAVLNTDIPEFDALKKRSHGVKILTYGRSGKDLHIKSLIPLPQGQKAELSLLGRPYTITFHLMGEFQVYNALCALGLVLADPEVNVERAIQGLPHLTPPAGRLEFVANTPKGAAVYVDYAHAEDAIQTVLKALKKHTQKQVWIVFGAGGGRDPGTRPPMGKAAADHADQVILTDDNPRFEDPDVIRAQLKQGAPDAHDIPDRRQAIAYALHHAQAGDIILVAGKGPEDGQIVQGKTEPFLDRRVILETIAEIR